MLGTRHIPFLTALRPTYSRYDDGIEEYEVEFRIDIDEEFVILVHQDARPTNPYFLKIRIQDIKQLADMLDRKT